MTKLLAIEPQITREESHVAKTMEQRDNLFILHAEVPHVYAYLTHANTPPLQQKTLTLWDVLIKKVH